MSTINAPSWTKIKLAEDLKQYLKHQAVDNGRSLAQEISERLEQSRRLDERAASAKPQPP